MRREDRVTVQGPVKKQQPDGMSHRGGGGLLPLEHRPGPERKRGQGTWGTVVHRGVCRWRSHCTGSAREVGTPDTARRLIARSEMPLRPDDTARGCAAQPPPPPLFPSPETYGQMWGGAVAGDAPCVAPCAVGGVGRTRLMGPPRQTVRRCPRGTGRPGAGGTGGMWCTPTSPPPSPPGPALFVPRHWLLCCSLASWPALYAGCAPWGMSYMCCYNTGGWGTGVAGGGLGEGGAGGRDWGGGGRRVQSAEEEGWGSATCHPPPPSTDSGRVRRSGAGPAGPRASHAPSAKALRTRTRPRVAAFPVPFGGAQRLCHVCCPWAFCAAGERAAGPPNKGRDRP